MPRGISSSKNIDTIPHSPAIAQNAPVAAGGHAVLVKINSTAVTKSPATPKLSISMRRSARGFLFASPVWFALLRERQRSLDSVLRMPQLFCEIVTLLDRALR